VGKGRIRNRKNVANLSKVCSQVTNASITGVKIFLSSLQKARKTVEKKIDDKIQEDINKKKKMLSQLDSQFQASMEKFKQEFSQNREIEKAKVEKSKQRITKLLSEQSLIEDNFLEEFEFIDKESETKFNQQMNKLYQEYDREILNYKNSLENYNTINTKNKILQEMIDSKIKNLSNYSEKDIQQKLSTIKSELKQQEPIITYQNLIELENQILLQSETGSLEKAIVKKNQVEDLFNSTIFYSDKIKNEIKIKINNINQYIKNGQYENAIKKSKTLIETINDIREYKENKYYPEKEKKYKDLMENSYDNQFLQQEIKDDVEMLEMTMDGKDGGEFQQLYESILNKISKEKGKLIINTIKETLTKNSYLDIDVSIDHQQRYKVRGFKENKPLTFWVSQNGSFDFDFPEDAFDNDKLCHQEIKIILKDIKFLLSKHGFSLNLFEVIRKFRLKDAAKDVIKEITHTEVEEVKNEDGTILLRSKGKKIKKQQIREKQVE